MVKKKIQPILPSLREKKRYLAFEIISKDKIADLNEIEDKIYQSSLQFLGQKGLAKAGIMVLKDKYDPESQKGLIRVNNKEVNNIKAAFTLIDKIENKEVIVKSIGVSGILKKAVNNYLTAR